MKKRVLALAFIMMLLLSVAVPAFAAPTDEKTLRHSVARIYVGDVYSDGSWGEAIWDPTGRGTGFFVGKEGENPQYLVTNRHVIDYYIKWGQGERTNVKNEDGEVVAYARAQIRVYFDSSDYVEAYLVEAGDTSEKDFAILRLAEPTNKRSALPICIPTQSMSDPNKKVIAIGFPGAADNEALKSVSQSGEKDSVITTGMINKLFTQTATGIPTIQFDATIQPGNSGGPLVFENGAAIGVTTWSVSGPNENMYYAVSMELIKPYLDRNNVPYTLLDVGEGGKAITGGDDTAKKDDEDKKDEREQNWLLYGILGAAIIGVAVVLIVLLRKPKTPQKKVGPETKTGGGRGITPPPPPASSRVLIGVEGPLKDKRFTIEKGKAIYIGRDKGKCKVLFPDKTPGVSSMHCKISFDGKTATIIDLKSSYGTAVDGKKLAPNTPTTLHRGLAIDIGSKSNRFVLQ